MHKLLTAFTASALVVACSEEPQVTGTTQAVTCPVIEIALAHAVGELASLSG